GVLVCEKISAWFLGACYISDLEEGAITGRYFAMALTIVCLLMYLENSEVLACFNECPSFGRASPLGLCTHRLAEQCEQDRRQRDRGALPPFAQLYFRVGAGQLRIGSLSNHWQGSYWR